jgi:tetratricopeptide (TPR) repeat protein
MSWNCVCKFSNQDDAIKCNNCGRKKPKYLGVKIEIDSTGKLTNEQLSVWYLMIAFSDLAELKKTQELYKDLNSKKGDMNYNQQVIITEINKCNSSAEYYCEKCLKAVEKALSLDPNPCFNDSQDAVQDSASIKSEAFFNLGYFYFDQGKYDLAIKNFEASYDADPNQVSIYNIAMATINLPVEGGGMFGGKKKEEAKALKLQQEIELLKKTILFSPFSELGVRSGRILLENYGISEIDI